MIYKKINILTRTLMLTLAITLNGCTRSYTDQPTPDTPTHQKTLLQQINSAKQFKTNEYKTHKHTLKNGLDVLIVEKPTTPVISVQLWYKVGSIYEIQGQKGLAHLFEHMMFRGSKNFGPQQHARLIRQAGGSCNAYTSDEVTVYHEKVPADKLELVLKLEADRMANLKLNQEILDTERKVVLEEYCLRVENDPIGAMQKDLRSFLFPDHPYEFGPIGKKEDIEAFTIENCREFHKKFYAPNNALLVIAGNVKTSETINMVETHFASIKSSKLPPSPDMSLDKNKIKTQQKAQTQIPIPVTLIAIYTDGNCDKDSIALEIIANSLAGSRSSRLWKTLVREKKLAEYFVGQTLQSKDTGIMFLAGAHLPFMSKKVKSEILKELEMIKTKGLEKNEFIKARNQLATQTTFQKYYANSLAASIAHSEAIKGNYKLYYQINEEIEAVTQDDIIRVANRYFTNDNIKVMIFEPKKGIFLANLLGLIKSIF